jgi:alkanesulfonate monooxygenase SsuD/methylene tetrahydromethanopterin reductase-like flavin-dependent oxidoreductase (luciferase family)
MEAQKHRLLQVGLHVPKATEMHGGGIAGWPELLAMAREAEAVGFDSLWVMDHLAASCGARSKETIGGSPWCSMCLPLTR